MDDFEIPEELRTPPERRLVGTLLTEKPRPESLAVSASVLAFIILVTELYWSPAFPWANALPASGESAIQSNEFWRIFTATLIHADLGHLASNLYMLGILGYFVFGYFGKWMFPIWTFLGSGLVNWLSVATYPPQVRLLGASGWVYLLGGFWLTSYLLIQRQYRFSQRLIRVLGIALMVFFPTSFEPTTSYRAHFFGFAIGIAMALVNFSINKNKIRKFEKYQIR